MNLPAAKSAAAAAAVALCIIASQAIAQIDAPSLKEIQDRVMIEDLMSRYDSSRCRVSGISRSAKFAAP